MLFTFIFSYLFFIFISMWSIYLTLLAKNAHELCEVNISYTGVLMVIITVIGFLITRCGYEPAISLKTTKNYTKQQMKFMTRAS
jgi:nitrate reductase gamma subunit